jgi:molecular chaperone HscB
MAKPVMVDDAFAVLGLPRTFDIDKDALQAAYLKRSAAMHPDRLRDPIEQARVEREAAVLNDARALLADEEQRANLLLTLLGGPAKQQDRSLPAGFLQQMMTVREEMESALADQDGRERTRMEHWASEQRRQHVATVRTLFEGMPDPPQADRLAAIRQELNAWRYVERMLQQLRDA